MNTRPIILGVHPVRGWQSADFSRRAWAVLCPGLLAAWALAFWLGPEAGTWWLVTFSAGGLGPPAFYSAARVVRPHAGKDGEREARHWCASTSTAFGSAVALALALDDALLLILAVPAALGLPVTVLWGLAALLVRACTAPVGQPRTWPSPVTT